MATRYWVGGTGNWDGSDTTHWSSSSGGSGGSSVPTSTDDVIFDSLSNATSYTVTITTAVSCQDLTIGSPVSGVPTLAGSAALDIYGSLSMASGMIRTYTGAISFKATSTGKTITSNGVSFASTFSFLGVGGGWTLQDDFTNASSLTVNNGDFNSNNKTITLSSGAGNFIAQASTTRSVTLGSSTITCVQWSIATTTNLTFNAGTSTINCSAAFQGGGLTYYNSVHTGNTTLTGANTFTNLTRTGSAVKTGIWVLGADQTITGTLTINGNSNTNRILVSSSIAGTQRTITAANVSCSNVDFMDIVGAGTGNWNLSAITGLSGDCGGNSGITFTTPATQTWSGTSGGNWSTNAWTSRVPLPQDDVVISQAFTASQTITVDMPRMGRSVDFTGSTGTPTIFSSIVNAVFGSLTFVASITNNLGTFLFQGRGSFTHTNVNHPFSGSVSLAAPTGTLTLQDSCTILSFTLNDGTFDLNNQNISLGSFISTSGRTRAINMGSGIISVTGQGTVWSVTSTNFTVNSQTSTIKFTDNSSADKTFSGGSMTYQNIWNATTGTGKLLIGGSNTFDNFRSNAGRTILFSAGTTQTINTATLTGTAGNEIVLDSTTTGVYSLVKSGGGIISGDYLNIQHCVATPSNTWYAGSHSTNNQGVTTAGSGWIFTDIPTTGNVLFFGSTF